MKVAVITGAGSGIGRAVAVRLAADGFTLALAGRRAERLAETATLVEQVRPEADSLVVPTDVADPAAVAALFSAVETELGRVDVLFNNAGSRSSRGPARGPDRRAVAVRRRRQPDRRVPLCAGRRAVDEAAVAAGRPDHQQRLHIRPRASSSFGALHRHQARHHGAHEVAPRSMAGRTASPADRSTSATRTTALTARMPEGVPQPDGSVRPEPTFAVEEVARRRLLHGRSAPGRERPLHDRDGHHDAVGGARLIRSCRRGSPAPQHMWLA